MPQGAAQRWCDAGFIGNVPGQEGFGLALLPERWLHQRAMRQQDLRLIFLFLLFIKGGLRVTSFSTLIRTRDSTSTDTFFSDYCRPPLLRFRSRDQPRAAGRTDWSCVLLHPFSILPLPFVSTFSGDSRLSASGCRRNQLHTGLHMAQLDQSFHPFSGNCTLHVVSSTGRLLLLWTLPLCCVADREPWVCWSRQLQHSIHSA